MAKWIESEGYRGEDRRNGNGKLLWWIMGIVASLIVALSGGWVLATNDTLINHADKITSAVSTINEVNKRLDRIEDKLDRALFSDRHG